MFATLWMTENISRFFLLPPTTVMVNGSLRIITLPGEHRNVSAGAVTPYEVTEDEAIRWAKEELGRTLDELKVGIDEKLADLRQQLEEFKNSPVSEDNQVTPNAASALFDLFKQLPRVIGQSLSGDDSRVETAHEAMTDLQQRLKESGIDLDDRFSHFPDRLAELRKETCQPEAAKSSKTVEPPPDKS